MKSFTNLLAIFFTVLSLLFSLSAQADNEEPELEGQTNIVAPNKVLKEPCFVVNLIEDEGPGYDYKEVARGPCDDYEWSAKAINKENETSIKPKGFIEVSRLKCGSYGYKAVKFPCTKIEVEVEEIPPKQPEPAPAETPAEPAPTAETAPAPDAADEQTSAGYDWEGRQPRRLFVLK